MNVDYPNILCSNWCWTNDPVHHCSEVTWALKRLKPTVTEQFVQQLIKADNNVKNLREGNASVDSSYKQPVTEKLFLVMVSSYVVNC